MAKDYEINYGGKNSNIPENLKSISEFEKNKIRNNFLKLKVVTVDSINEISYLPLSVKISGKFINNDIYIDVVVENYTNQKWFIPSPSMYHGNRFLTLMDDVGMYHYPDIKYKNRVVTNDETMLVIQEKDKIKIKYKLNLNDRLCNNVSKLYVEHRFLPVFLINDDKYVFERKSHGAVIRSDNYLKIDCKNKLIDSFVSK